MKEEPKACSICGRDYYGYGNNAWPINPGRCCDDCNNLVITHQIRNVQRGGYAYQAPEWVEKYLANLSSKSENLDD